MIANQLIVGNEYKIQTDCDVLSGRAINSHMLMCNQEIYYVEQEYGLVYQTFFDEGMERFVRSFEHSPLKIVSFECTTVLQKFTISVTQNGRPFTTVVETTIDLLDVKNDVYPDMLPAAFRSMLVEPYTIKIFKGAIKTKYTLFFKYTNSIYAQHVETFTNPDLSSCVPKEFSDQRGFKEVADFWIEEGHVGFACSVTAEFLRRFTDPKHNFDDEAKQFQSWYSLVWNYNGGINHNVPRHVKEYVLMVYQDQLPYVLFQQRDEVESIIQRIRLSIAGWYAIPESVTSVSDETRNDF